MIKINRNSWHYKLVNCSFGAYNYNSLCQYMRALVVSLIVAVLFALAGVVYCFVLFAPLWSNFIFDLDLGYGLYLISCVLWIITITVAACFIEDGIDDDSVWKEKHHILPREKKNKTANILRQWFKSMHDKVCPMIEYYRDE